MTTFSRQQKKLFLLSLPTFSKRRSSLEYTLFPLPSSGQNSESALTINDKPYGHNSFDSVAVPVLLLNNNTWD